MCFQNSKYYKGGFDPKMSRREAGLVLGVRLVVLEYLYTPLQNSAEKKGANSVLIKRITLKSVTLLCLR